MNRKSFWIPVGWDEGRAPDHRFFLNSNTLVIPVPWTHAGPFDVERIPGSWSPHIPEKKALYRVGIGDEDERSRWRRRRQGVAIESSPERLQTLRIGTRFVVPLVTDRNQTCLDYKGALHGIYTNGGGLWPIMYCGESTHYSSRDTIPYVSERPTCKACLKYKSVWCCYTVFSYVPKVEIEKAIDEVKRVEARYLRLPTAYARILDDDFLENPSYKPPKERPLLVDEADATEDYEDPRDRKRESAIDRNRRLEESKARVQGHRR